MLQYQINKCCYLQGSLTVKLHREIMSEKTRPYSATADSSIILEYQKITKVSKKLQRQLQMRIINIYLSSEEVKKPVDNLGINIIV